MIVPNLAESFGVLADTIEVVLTVVFIVLGIGATHLVQRWADRLGEQPPAANTALGGAADRYEQRGFRR